MRGSSSSSRAVTSLKLNSVVKESGRIPPDVHASHIHPLQLPSHQPIGQGGAHEALGVELTHIKKILGPSGKTYGHQKPVEEILAGTE